MISKTFIHLKASLFDHHHSLHHIISVFVPPPLALGTRGLRSFGHSDNLFVNIIYNQVTDVCGSAAVRGKIMPRTEESNKIVVFVG